MNLTNPMNRKNTKECEIYFSKLENYPGECKSYLCLKLPMKINHFNAFSVSLAIFPIWKNYQVSALCVCIFCIAGQLSQLYGLKWT